MKNIITDEDINNFSEVEDVRKMALKAVQRVDRIYPVYILTRVNQQTGEITDSTKEMLSTYYQLARAAAKIDDKFLPKVEIALSVYRFDAHTYMPYTVYKYASLLKADAPVMRIFQHNCTDYNFKCASPNVVSNIRNECIKDYVARNICGHMFFIEDDMLLQRVYDYDENGKPVLKTCNTWQDLLIALAIWQYYTMFKPYVTLDKPIGMSGFPGYDSMCHAHKDDVTSDVYRVDTTRLTNCVLLNINEMQMHDLQYETVHDCWDDLDMNLQFAAIAKAHSVALDYPICTTTNRPMVSTTSNISYSSQKLNNYCAQLYYKWGDIIRFRPWKDVDGNIYAINAKLPDDFSSLVNTKKKFEPTFNEQTLQDLRTLLASSDADYYTNLNAFITNNASIWVDIL